MKKSWCSVVVFVMVVLAGSVPIVASAQPGHGRTAGAQIAGFLDLSEDQVEQWKGIRASHEEAAKQLLAQRRQLGQQLRNHLEGKTPDAGEVGALVIELHGVRGQLRSLHDDYVSAFVEMLSPSQRRQYDQVLSQRHRRGLDRAFRRARIIPRGERS